MEELSLKKIKESHINKQLGDNAMAQRPLKETPGEHVVKRRGVWVRGVNIRWHNKGVHKIRCVFQMSFAFVDRGATDVF